MSRSVTLEHIYPQNPPAGLKIEDHGDLVDRIGNLTLLLGNWNSKLSNRSFTEKKKRYSKSDLMITSELRKHKMWSRTQVESRQKEFAKSGTPHLETRLAKHLRRNRKRSLPLVA